MKKRLIKKAQPGENTNKWYSLNLVDKGWIYDNNKNNYIYTYPGGKEIITYDPIEHTFLATDENGLGKYYHVNRESVGNGISSYTPHTDSYKTSDIDSILKQAKENGESQITISSLSGLSDEDINEIVKSADKLGMTVKATAPSLGEVEVIGNKNLTPIDTDFQYANQFFPALVSNPDKFHDPNIVDLYSKEHTNGEVMTLTAYEKKNEEINNLTNSAMALGAGTLIGGALPEIGLSKLATGIGLTAIKYGRPVVNTAWKGINFGFNTLDYLYNPYRLPTTILSYSTKRLPWLSNTINFVGNGLGVGYWTKMATEHGTETVGNIIKGKSEENTGSDYLWFPLEASMAYNATKNTLGNLASRKFIPALINAGLYGSGAYLPNVFNEENTYPYIYFNAGPKGLFDFIIELHKERERLNKLLNTNEDDEDDY